MSDIYEVFALKYAHRGDRTSSQNFLGGDPHDHPMPLDYFVWVIRNSERCYVVDTGFGNRSAAERGVKDHRRPAEVLNQFGLDAGQVDNVIITHMHYDHAGGLEDFPKATFHVQEEEMWFTTGSCMCHPSLKHAYDVEHVCQMVRNVFDGRVHFHKGDAAIAPGLSLHHIGGHTAGMMSVRVNTARGQVVLASDASHFYANMEDKRPFVIVYNHADMMQGHRKLYELADSQNHVIPGHDPLGMQRYAAPSDDLAGVAVRLDVAPNLG